MKIKIHIKQGKRGKVSERETDRQSDRERARE